MHRPLNSRTAQALEKIIGHNRLWEQLFQLGLNPDHFAVHALHNRQPLIDLSYVIRVNDKHLDETLQNLQQEIWRVVGDDQYYTPSGEFHITLYTHVYADHEYRNVDIQPTTYAADYARYCQWAERQADAVLRPTPAWGILYTNVLVTPDSVIAVAEDTGTMQRLRHDLVHFGNHEHFYDNRDEKTIYPNIIHTTLARFLTPVTLEQRLSIYEKIRPQLPLLLPVQIQEIEFRQFYRYGVFPQEKPIFTVKLLPQE